MDIQGSANIFRAYDIRGIVDVNLTSDIIDVIGRALGTQALLLQQQQIILGCDARLSSPRLKASLLNGLLSTGIDVIDIGEVPTPLLYFATHTLSTQSGVMLTGSHNPAEYNGLKMVLKGNTLSEKEIQLLYNRILAKDFIKGQGNIELTNVVEAYSQRVLNDIKLQRSLNIVVDCGNGVTGTIAPRLFQELGCHVIPLYAEVDGRFPHHHPDPSQPKNLQALIEAVQKEKADIGIAFDGDGDRLGVVTDRGEIIWPDRQMMLFAIDVLSRCTNASIIFDVKCSRYLQEIILRAGGQPCMWKTGHSLIKEKMRQMNALLAGEMSGHIFFKERWYGFDDAMYAAARLLEIISASSQSCSDIFRSLPNSVNTPELKISMSDERKFSFIEELSTKAKFPDATVNVIDGLRVDYQKGWGLIRASNTTPCLILRFEAESQEQMDYIQSHFRDQLLTVDPHLELPF